MNNSTPVHLRPLAEMETRCRYPRCNEPAVGYLDNLCEEHYRICEDDIEERRREQAKRRKGIAL